MRHLCWIRQEQQRWAVGRPTEATQDTTVCEKGFYLENAKQMRHPTLEEAWWWQQQCVRVLALSFSQYSN